MLMLPIGTKARVYEGNQSVTREKVLGISWGGSQCIAPDCAVTSGNSKREGRKRMDRNQILQLIGEEITRLERVKELLSATNGHHLLSNKVRKAANLPKKRILSEDARNRIAQAQRRRWAKQRKEAALAKKA